MSERSETEKAIDNFEAVKQTLLVLDHNLKDIQRGINDTTKGIEQCEKIEFDIEHMLENLDDPYHRDATAVLGQELALIRKKRRDLKRAKYIYVGNEKDVMRFLPQLKVMIECLKEPDMAGSPYYNAYKFRTIEMYEIARGLGIASNNDSFHLFPPQDMPTDEEIETIEIETAEDGVIDTITVAANEPEIVMPLKPKKVKADGVMMSRVGKHYKVFCNGVEIFSDEKFLEVMKFVIGYDPDYCEMKKNVYSGFKTFQRSFEGEKIKTDAFTYNDLMMFALKTYPL